MKPAPLSYLINRVTTGKVKYGWWTSSYQSAASPIVLGGCSRSGTTLLRRLLSAHPALYIGPETAILSMGNRDLAHLARVTELDPACLRRYYRQSICMGQFAELVLTDLMTREGKRRWGEKTPANVRRLERIFRFFPEARFVHILRDGRDVVCSLRTHPKYRFEDGQRVPTGVVNPWLGCTQEWVTDVRAGLKWRGDPRFYELKYEALVADPEATLRPLVQWLGEDWDPAILHSYRTDGLELQPRLAGAIDSGAVGRWQADLPAEARKTFEPEGCQLLTELGYAADGTWV
jgi:hypothetical protein